MREIGRGWGSFAIEAVRKTGCRVSTITLSSEQADVARQRVKEAGFEEMIEHVGLNIWTRILRAWTDI